MSTTLVTTPPSPQGRHTGVEVGVFEKVTVVRVLFQRTTLKAFFCMPSAAFG